MEDAFCKYCSKAFLVKPSVRMRGNGKFCVLACYRASIHTGKSVYCITCQKTTYRRGKDLMRSKSKKFFCSKKCQTIWRNQLYRGSAHKNFKTGKSSYRNIMIRSDQQRACQVCGMKDIRILIVHHIDKDRENNTLVNLA